MAVKTVPAARWGMEPLDADKVAHRELAIVVEANVHHSAGAPPTEHRRCAATVRAIDDYHREHNGWAGGGYHRVICAHGVVFLMRPLDVVPAAAENHNTPVAAYCLLADDDDKATRAQLEALEAMRERDERAIGHALRWTTHREVEPPGYTECPGDGIEGQVVKLRRGEVPPAPVVPKPRRRHRHVELDGVRLPVIGAGDTGPGVRRLQALLLAAGFDPHGVDGDAGEHTIRALERLQRVELGPAAVSGRTNAATWRALLGQHEGDGK